MVSQSKVISGLQDHLTNGAFVIYAGVKSMKEVTCQDVMNSGSQERCETWNKQYIIFVICAVVKSMKDVTCQGVMSSGTV